MAPADPGRLGGERLFRRGDGAGRRAQRPLSRGKRVLGPGQSRGGRRGGGWGRVRLDVSPASGRGGVGWIRSSRGLRRSGPGLEEEPLGLITATKLQVARGAEGLSR